MEHVDGVGPDGRGVAAGEGIEWWSRAWALFMKQPLLWIIGGIIFIVINAGLHVVPVLGSFAAALLTPVLFGGWMIAARKVDQTGELEIGDLFDGFKSALNPLLVVGAVLLACEVGIALFTGMLGLGVLGAIGVGGLAGSPATMAAGLGIGMVGILVAVVLFFVVMMALWFAPPLIVFDGMAPMDAMKASVAASLRNVVPFLLYDVVLLVVGCLATLPALLGWILLMPVYLITMYTSYRSVFGR